MEETGQECGYMVGGVWRQLFEGRKGAHDAGPAYMIIMTLDPIRARIREAAAPPYN